MANNTYGWLNIYGEFVYTGTWQQCVDWYESQSNIAALDKMVRL